MSSRSNPCVYSRVRNSTQEHTTTQSYGVEVLRSQRLIAGSIWGKHLSVLGLHCPCHSRFGALLAFRGLEPASAGWFCVTRANFSPKTHVLFSLVGRCLHRSRSARFECGVNIRGRPNRVAARSVSTKPRLLGEYWNSDGGTSE